jgi:hypothetical protein
MNKCELCKRNATQSNADYFPGKWLCTLHAKIMIRKGRIAKKLNKLKERKVN